MALDQNINRIKFLRTTVAGRKPALADLQDGELALNLVDRTIYTRNDNNIVDIGFGKGGNVDGDVTVSGKLNVTGIISGVATNARVLDPKALYSENASTQPADLAKGITTSFVSSSEGWPFNYGNLLTMNSYPGGSGGAALQLLTPYTASYGESLRFRLGQHGTPTTWSDWKFILDSGNFNTYAPTKTGVGATGSWGINSATASKLQTARSISLTGQSSGSVVFDGSGNVSLDTTNTNLKTVLMGAETIESHSWDEFVVLSRATGVPADSPFQNAIKAMNIGQSSWNTQLCFDAYKNRMAIRSRSTNNGAFNPWDIVALESGNVESANRLNSSRFFSTSATQYYRVATLSIPNSGGVGIVYLNGGQGFNSLQKQSASYTLTVKQSTPTSASLVVETADTNFVNSSEFFLKNVSDRNWEIWAYITQYTTFYAHTLSDKNTSIKLLFDSETATKPSPVTDAYLRQFALLQSNVASATKLQNARTINGVSFDGTSNILTPANEFVLPLDARGISKPSDFVGRRWYSTFARKSDLESGASSTLYGDMLVTSGYGDSSGGYVNALFIPKVSNSTDRKNILHYSAAFGASAWNAPRELAYTDDDITGNSDSATKLQNARTINGVSFDGTANIVIEDSTKLNLSGGTISGALSVSGQVELSNNLLLNNSRILSPDPVAFFNGSNAQRIHVGAILVSNSYGEANKVPANGAYIKGGILSGTTITVEDNGSNFQKLIQMSNVTDGGYLAVGNTGSDKGYVELGTIDDVTTSIYVRKRNSSNAVLATQVLMDENNNAQFVGNLSAANGLAVGSTSQTAGYGIGLYGGNAGTETNLPDYGIAMAGTATFGTYGTSISNNDLAVYFTMNGAATRGWIFKNGDAAASSNVVSISANGMITSKNLQVESGVIRGGINTSSNHYIDIGKDDSDRQIFGSYAGLYYFRRTSNSSDGVVFNDGNITATGNITAYSDKRLKDNIKRIENAQDKVNRLNGVTFNRIDCNGEKQTGLLAQDVLEVMPMSVVENESGYLSVNYNSLIGLLVEAIKEQDKRIKILEEKIK